jgi:hypothetical protein
MAMTFTETLGFVDKLVQYLTANQPALQTKGLAVAAWITELGTLKQAMLVADSEQEALKAQLRAKTAEVDVAQDAAYRTSSTRLDTVIAILGKTTEEGKQLARLRSEVRRGPGAPDASPPAPVSA